MRREVVRWWVCICLFLLVNFLPALVFADVGNWSQRTARLLPAGRLEFLLFGPSRYAFQERVELGVSILPLFAVPNAQLKVAWSTPQRPWALATRHRLYAPGVLGDVLEGRPVGTSPRLRLVADTDLLMTRALRDGWVTMQLGVVGAICCGQDDWSEPTQALMRPRVPTSDADADVVTRGGAILRHFIGRKGWFVEGEGQVHLMPSARSTWLELDAAVGLERRHLFVQFGGRSSFDGTQLSTTPRFELGFALE